MLTTAKEETLDDDHGGRHHDAGPGEGVDDASPGKQPFKDSSGPYDESARRQHRNVTPPEIVEAALALTPDWVPQITPSRCARTATKQTSL